MNVKILSFLLFYGLPIILIAQNNREIAKEISNDIESYFLMDISYINDAVFMGRRDSIAAPYIYPSIGYYNASGLFVDISASYLVGSEDNRVDLFMPSLGYDFSNLQLSGRISGTAYFFNKESYNVKSAVLADVSGFLSYNLKILEATLMTNIFFNDGGTSDFFVGLMVNRIFYTNDRNFLVNPTISLYAGSQNFYEVYYKTSRLGNRRGSGQGLGATNLNSATTVEISEATKFNILNLELSLPLQYYHKQFIFSLNPILAIPQSSATITTEDSVISEDLESTFYFTASISYWFDMAKRKS